MFTRAKFSRTYFTRVIIPLGEGALIELAGQIDKLF